MAVAGGCVASGLFLHGAAPALKVTPRLRLLAGGVTFLAAGGLAAAPALCLVGGVGGKTSDSSASSLLCAVFHGLLRCTVVHGTSAASGGGLLGAGEADGMRLAAWASAYLAFLVTSLGGGCAPHGFVYQANRGGIHSASTRVSKHQSHLSIDLAMVYLQRHAQVGLPREPRNLSSAMLYWSIAAAGTVEPWCSANLRSCSSDALCWWAAFLARLLALRRLWCQVGSLPSAPYFVLSARAGAVAEPERTWAWASGCGGGGVVHLSLPQPKPGMA